MTSRGQPCYALNLTDRGFSLRQNVQNFKKSSWKYFSKEKPSFSKRHRYEYNEFTWIKIKIHYSTQLYSISKIHEVKKILPGPSGLVAWWWDMIRYVLKYMSLAACCCSELVNVFFVWIYFCFGLADWNLLLRSFSLPKFLFEHT